jgi:hypothetical protein
MDQEPRLARQERRRLLLNLQKSIVRPNRSERLKFK